MPKKPTLPPPPPHTLDDLAKWIQHVADQTWHARRSAVGLRFVLGNLLMELHRNEGLDAPAFMTALLADAQRLPPGFEADAMRELVQDVLAQLPAIGAGAPPPGTVFH